MESGPTPAQRATAALLDGVGISENAVDLAKEGLPTPIEPPTSVIAPPVPPIPVRRAAKRTASGAIKDSEGRHPSSEMIPRRHTRGASTSSATSELSSRLRTNLSYALLKVRNGWESRSLDDLEEQASRQALSLSPVRRPMYPTPSDRSSEPPHHVEPRTLPKQQSAPESLSALIPSTPRPRSLARPGSGAALATPSTLPGGRRAHHARVRSQGPILDDYAFSPTFISPGTTVFPRPHPLGEESTSDGSNEDERRQYLSQRTPKTHLSPTRPAFTPLATYGDGRSPRRNTIGSVRMMDPGAIPRSTVSQPDGSYSTDERLGKAEQDALETLMFMSSPGNSQNIASRA